MTTYARQAEPRKRFPLIRLLLVLVLIALAAWQAPRALDRTPPELSVKGLEAGRRYGGTVELTIQGEDTGRGLSKVAVFEDGISLAEIQLEGKTARTVYAWDTTVPPNGGIRLIEVVLSDASLWHKSTRQSFDIIVDNVPPEVTATTSPAAATQGQTFAVFLETNEELRKASGQFLGKEIPFFAVGRWMRALVGIPIGAKVGTHAMQIRATDLVGNERAFSQDVKLQKGSFKTGVVQLPKTKRSLLTDQSKKTVNREKRADALEMSVSTQLWTDFFQKPTKGVTTSTFGARRVYNNGVVRSVHSGWDIADKEGTAVYAANDGVVVLAEELPIHGNNILLDHGQGVASGYAHLSAILVEAGEAVEKGQLIGRMGTTGQSTGSHLHWDMFVHRVPVDPKQWLTTAFSKP